MVLNSSPRGHENPVVGHVFPSWCHLRRVATNVIECFCIFWTSIRKRSYIWKVHVLPFQKAALFASNQLDPHEVQMSRSFSAWFRLCSPAATWCATFCIAAPEVSSSGTESLRNFSNYVANPAFSRSPSKTPNDPLRPDLPLILIVPRSDLDSFLVSWIISKSTSQPNLI